MFECFFDLYSQDGLKHLIANGGLALLAGIVFAETGVLAGFFLPGDSLLVTAGVFCVTDPIALLQHPAVPPPPVFDFTTTAIVLCLAAIAGDWVNYGMACLFRDRVDSWQDGRFYKRQYLNEAKEFYTAWGGSALVLGRFVPIARTFVPFAAGLAGMPFWRFSLWNAVGGLLWVLSMLGLGYLFGTNEFLVKRLHLLVLATVAVSFVPVIWGIIARWRRGPQSAPAAVPPKVAP